MNRLTRRTVTSVLSDRTQPTTLHYLGSTKMYSMHEAFARERMHDAKRRARESRVAHDVAAHRRWHRVSVRARAAEARYARRVNRAAHAA
jgi:hypothetical protein